MPRFAGAVDHQRRAVFAQHRQYIFAQAVEQRVGTEYGAVGAQLVQVDIAVGDAQVNDVDVEKSRGAEHQLAQQFTAVVNIDRLVLGLVDQVELLVATGELVGHEIELQQAGEAANRRHFVEGRGVVAGAEVQAERQQ